MWRPTRSVKAFQRWEDDGWLRQPDDLGVHGRHERGTRVAGHWDGPRGCSRPTGPARPAHNRRMGSRPGRRHPHTAEAQRTAIASATVADLSQAGVSVAMGVAPSSKSRPPAPSPHEPPTDPGRPRSWLTDRPPIARQESDPGAERRLTALHRLQERGHLATAGPASDRRTSAGGGHGDSPSPPPPAPRRSSPACLVLASRPDGDSASHGRSTEHDRCTRQLPRRWRVGGPSASRPERPCATRRAPTDTLDEHDLEGIATVGEALVRWAGAGSGWRTEATTRSI